VANLVTFSRNQAFITSDSSVLQRFLVLQAEDAVLVGLDQVDLALIDAKFSDLAATAEATVPDTGTTFSLLGLSHELGFPSPEALLEERGFGSQFPIRTSPAGRAASSASKKVRSIDAVLLL
jgi:hypothetical protein